jgi:hypothetical protein
MLLLIRQVAKLKRASIQAAPRLQKKKLRFARSKRADEKPQQGLSRISHTLATHLANHSAASGLVLPHHITLDMPWSSSPPGDQSIAQSEPTECEISGLTDRLDRDFIVVGLRPYPILLVHLGTPAVITADSHLLMV